MTQLSLALLHSHTHTHKSGKIQCHNPIFPFSFHNFLSNQTDNPRPTIFYTYSKHTHPGLIQLDDSDKLSSSLLSNKRKAAKISVKSQSFPFHLTIFAATKLENPKTRNFPPPISQNFLFFYSVL
jgi:hypothetical protein